MIFIILIIILLVVLVCNKEEKKCPKCGGKLIEKDTDDYPYLTIGLASGNIALGLLPDTKLYCPKCKKEIKQQ